MAEVTITFTDAEVSALNSKNAAQTARTGAETAETNAVTAKNAAETAQTGAETAETGAVTAKDLAQAAETGAVTARTVSETARDLSQEFANKAEDVEVQPGLYSSLHFSKKAEDEKDQSVTARQGAVTAEQGAVTAKNEAETARDYLESELFHYISDDNTSVKVGIGTQVLVSESTTGYDSIQLQFNLG